MTDSIYFVKLLLELSVNPSSISQICYRYIEDVLEEV